jgi:cell division protein FtsN
MGPNALIGVHSASENGEENLTSMGVTTAFARDVAAYGVPDSIIGKLVQTEPGRMTWLTPSDLKPMGVVVLPASSPQSQPLPTAIPQPPPKTTLEPAKTVYVVQVGSKRSWQEALASFADMQRHYPSLLNGYRPLVQKADLGTLGIWYRLRIGPVDEKDKAIKLCIQLKSLGLPDCLVTAY